MFEVSCSLEALAYGQQETKGVLKRVCSQEIKDNLHRGFLIYLFESIELRMSEARECWRNTELPQARTPEIVLLSPVGRTALFLLLLDVQQQEYISGVNYQASDDVKLLLFVVNCSKLGNI